MAPPKPTCVLAIALLLVASVNCTDFVRFTYQGSEGPQNWAKLSPGYSACSNGKSQSPIDIKVDGVVQDDTLTPLTRNYKSANATLVNHGFSIGVQFESESGTLDVDGKKYELKQFHFHTPSDHRVDGKQFAAELHLVHMAQDGTLAVVAILFKEGDSDSFVGKIQSKLGELAKETCSGDQVAHIPLGKLDNKLLRKNTRKYYRYVGSLTTPPCTENVSWSILGKVREISKEQVAALKAPLWGECKDNSRPVQSLNGRKVELYNELNQ
ncbi:hypothetical protein Tsubulata_020959 [Turnera subulata]|uniref:Alpha-carbonic anhydrase domain-containing protein n=1 Tax=Turnera subulata TaxID=218843 RepID=A0A9Q0GIT2_9ROSI|nr:hypothetical protein Tsubulata_020959 [Turnera subulata]